MGVVVVVIEDIVIVEGAVIAKVVEDQVLHYVKYLTGSVGSNGNSNGSSSGSRRHSLIRRRTHSESNRGSGTSLCEYLTGSTGSSSSSSRRLGLNRRRSNSKSNSWQ